MNIRLRIKRGWNRYRSYRQLRSYYHSELGRGSGGKHLLGFLLFILGSIYILQRSETVGQSLPRIFVLLIMIYLGSLLWSLWETTRMGKICQGRIAEAKFRKNLERTPPLEVLQQLGELVAQSYGVTDLQLNGNYLQGTYQGEKLALLFSHYEQDEVMTTQEMIAFLRECKQQGITQARVFVNTDFSPKAKGLGERFELELRTYNGRQLLRFLQESSLYPSKYEIETLIKEESAKRMRRLAILRREAVRGNKFFTYLVYSGVLLSMAWFRIGYLYLNLSFGLILLVLAFLSLLRSWPKKEEDTSF